MTHLISFEKFFGATVIAFTADRAADFHFDRSTPAFNAKQKAFLAHEAGIREVDFFNIQQVHGRRVVLACSHQDRISRADASATNKSGIALMVRTADCVPVFLYDPRHRAIALVHAGWRSAYKKIVPNALRLMKRRFGTQARDVKAALGPAIQRCCCEVEERFLRYFPGAVKKRNGKFYLDLALALRQQMIGLGVKPRNIRDCKLCTFCDKRFFSYRREGAATGRILSLMMIKR